MASSTVARVADQLPEYRVVFAFSYASALVAMLLTYVYIEGGGVAEQNPITRAAFTALPETTGVAFAVVLVGKAVVLVALYRVILPWTVAVVHDEFDTDHGATLVAAWAGALVSGLDATLNFLAPFVYPAPVLIEGVSVFMAAFLVVVVAGLVAMPDRDVLADERVETTEQRPPWAEVSN